MKKHEVIANLVEAGIVSVLRICDKTVLYPTVSALKKGGINVIEVTCTVPSADLIIEELNNDSDLLVGAGTVLDEFTARLCIMRGASFIVSPAFSPKVAQICNLYDIVYIPGVATPFEICEAMKLGSYLLKLFPASNLSPSIIKDFLGPFPQCGFMPTGGVSLENVGTWIKAGASLVGVGGLLTKGSKTKDYDLVCETAKAFLLEISNARNSMNSI